VSHGVRKVRDGEASGEGDVCQSVLREADKHGRERGDKSNEQRAGAEGRNDGTDKTRNLRYAFGAPSKRGGTQGSHGHKDQNLFRHGIRAWRRTLRQNLQRQTQRGSGPQILPAIDQRRWLLPQPRRLPPRSQTRESTPRRRRKPQNLRLRSLRAAGTASLRRAPPHAVWDPCLRGTGGLEKKRLRRLKSRYLVMRRRSVRSPRWLSPLPTRESDDHV